MATGHSLLVGHSLCAWQLGCRWSIQRFPYYDLAIVDDLGAVLVIALFYTSEISFASIAVGVVFLLAMFIANKLGVKNVIFYGVLGIGGVWIAFLMSGIHATIAAVLAAFMIPADARISEPVYLARAQSLSTGSERQSLTMCLRSSMSRWR